MMGHCYKAVHELRVLKSADVSVWHVATAPPRQVINASTGLPSRADKMALPLH